jgi:hypothetical protein
MDRARPRRQTHSILLLRDWRSGFVPLAGGSHRAGIFAPFHARISPRSAKVGLGPFGGTIEGIGRPAAADKLLALLTTSPALAGMGLPTDVLEAHARAFNQFRNATLHYGGLPAAKPTDKALLGRVSERAGRNEE